MHNPTRGIIPWFVANPVAANLLLILVVMLGILQMGSLRKEAFPSMDPHSLSVSVSYSSGSAQQAEEGLAIKIEDQLEDVTGIDSITSKSTSSGVSVSIEMQDDYDLDQLLRDVTSKIDAISTFPADAKNPVIEKAEREEHSLWLQLYGNADRSTLQHLADELKSDLLASDAISRVSISGRQDPMMVVEIEEARLRAYGLSLSDVEEAINQSSSSTATAVMHNEQLNLQLKSSEQAYQKEDFAAIPLLTTSDGHRLLLGEVATISDTFDDETAVLSRYNGENTISLQVITTGLDDISDSATAARNIAEQWQNGSKLVQGVELATWYDRSTSINDRLQLLVKNALTGIFLVFILLALFLNLTVAFWVAMGLPFIFFGTLYIMGTSFIGLTLNEFTTFGFIMALGIVVDDAVVVGESVYTLRAANGDNRENTIKGTLRVALPTIFGVFTTVAAFYALSQIDGHLGQLYSQFATVVAICLILSVIESKLILPAHLAHLNTRPQISTNPLLRLWSTVQKGADWVLNQFSNRCYKPVIAYALHHRYAITILFVTLFGLVVSMPFTGLLRISFFPDIPGDTVVASLTMQNDTSFGQTHDALNLLEQRAYQTDLELRGVSPTTFISSLQLLSEADQSGTITLELAEDAPYDIKTFTRHWQQLAGMPEGSRTLSIQNTRRMVDALRLELRAADDTILTAAGEALKEQLEAIPSISGIEDNLQPGQPQLQLQLTEQGRALGMTTEMLAEQIFQGFSGQVVQRYQRNSDEIEVKVRYPEAERQNSTDLLNSSVRTSDGTVLPLTTVATVSYGYSRDSITRIDGKRAVYISADVDKDTVSATELVHTLKTTLTPALLANYPGLSIYFAGEAEQQAETQSSMIHVFILALLMIYMLLAIPLKSYIQPLLIMTAIPFGIVGAILGHWLNDLSLGILSLNGIIALSGVVVNDSLLLVSRFNTLRDEGLELHEAITEACRSRLRAVLLTSFTTFAGLMPLLGETSTQAQFLIPAAVSLAYGIMFATVITLILIPSLLMIQHDCKKLLTSVYRLYFPEKRQQQIC
jgi:multidrug efflux pump subunit AcrB